MEFFKRIGRRAWAILARPETEWAAIAGEPPTYSLLFLRYVAILALIPALSRFAGASLVGRYAPIMPSLAGALIIYLSGFVSIYVVGLAIDVLAPRFAARKDFANAQTLAVYTATPVYLAGIFLVVPGLSFLALFGLYAIYLLWSGLPILMRAPAKRTLAYTMAVSLVALIAVAVLSLIAAPFFNPATTAPSP
jgi:Yip1 domain